MRNIVVSKFGNEPDIFGDSLRVGMIGDWEVKKLLQVLSADKENCVTYYGKAKWDNEAATKAFPNKNVQFIECQQTDDASIISTMTGIDEFHILLGPHSIYNGGKNVPSWESIKASLVTQRLLERVAPQIKLMNASENAKCYFYASDRRFLLMAADIINDNIRVFSQIFKSFNYKLPYFSREHYTSLTTISQKVEPIRFDTLWLVGKNEEQFKINMNKDFLQCHINLVIPANQVTSDDEIHHSRFSKIMDYTDYIKDFTIVGKWTKDYVKDAFCNASCSKHYLDGLDIELYNKALLDSKYALITYNTYDAPGCFENNFLTPKYWECVYNGCITFVESSQLPDTPFIPKELQVCTGKELRDKIDKCENDIKYKNMLKQLQLNLVKSEYFSDAYFTNWLNEQRGNWDD